MEANKRSNMSAQPKATPAQPYECSWLVLEAQRKYSTRQKLRSPYRNEMSEKLRSRLRKRGRGVVECDDVYNCV